MAPSGGTPCNSHHINLRAVSRHIDKTHKESSLLGSPHKFNLTGSRKNRLKEQSLLRKETFLTDFFRFFCSFKYCFGIIPITEFLLGNPVWIHLNKTLSPIMTSSQNISENCFPGTIWSRNHNKNWFPLSHARLQVWPPASYSDGSP